MNKNEIEVTSEFVYKRTKSHCKAEQVEPAYIECGNSAAAMQVSQVNLFELDQTK